MRFLLCGVLRNDHGRVTDCLKQAFGVAAEVQCQIVQQKTPVRVTVFYSQKEQFFCRDEVTAQIDRALKAPGCGQRPYQLDGAVHFEEEIPDANAVGQMW